MRKESQSSNIYQRETRLLDEVAQVKSDSTISKETLLQEYTRLGKEYDKLLRNAIKITSIGDANQRKLMRSLKLEQEKQQLQQIVKDRTKEIEEKNQQLERQTTLLEEKSEKLRTLSEIKSRFFANISHEFRTPLTLIIGPLEQMLVKCSNYDDRKKLTLMLRNSQRLLGLINQLLELSKFESGRSKLQAALQNIVPFLRGTASSFELLAAQNELDLIFYAENEDISLYFDPALLEEAIYNLLLNAIKFTPPGGQITVAVEICREPGKGFSNGCVLITVADTGLGIPANRLEQIFERFYQVEARYESKHKGSGIGLAIVKEILELHRGDIGVESSRGENSGTKFTIRLPLGKDHLPTDEIVDLSASPYMLKSHSEIRELYMVEKEEKENVYGKGRKAVGSRSETRRESLEKNTILVVEDSCDVRNYIKGALEPDYNVVEAVDGQQGIDTAREVIPDLIISDIMMPGADGYELCRELKNDVATSHVPIILLTAKASEDAVIEGLETGADDYVTKPFNTKILRARIKNLIDLRRHLQETFKREMTLQPAGISLSKLDKEFLEELQEVINKNIYDPELNVEKLGKMLYMSRATLYRKILALTGEPPNEFIRSYRLKRGAQLLKENFGSVTEVAYEVGFSSSAYFTKRFKEKFHQLPSIFQRTQGIENVSQ
jgi:signal transduction histidine kinase/DNA-binding response OmpR family regulator